MILSFSLVITPFCSFSRFVLQFFEMAQKDAVSKRANRFETAWKLTFP